MSKKYTSLLVLLMATSMLSWAQTPEQRKQIIADYDQEQNREILLQFQREEQRALNEVTLYAQRNNVPIFSVDEQGNERLLVSIDPNGQPVYRTTNNFVGALTINANHLYTGESLGLSIEGSGINAGIWDGGYARQTHQDIVGRVTYGETNTNVSGHASHVGGTMIGDGTGGLPNRGVAFRGTLTSYRFDSDQQEMLIEASAGMLISNHSYGREVTSNTPTSVYGKYDGRSSGFDVITSINPYYLPVVSAGNDRNDGLNTSKNGYDLLTDISLAKNVITVGAVNNVFPYSGPSSVTMSNFSSWGPADDGRIKPDIVAKGVGVRSLSGSSDTAYATRQGTSMSAPMVSGGLMLLQELHNQEQNRFMRAATAKGLVLLTAREAGVADGPDAQFGWGLMDVKAAAELILEMDNSTLLEERNLANNATYSTTVTSNQPVLKVGISWTERSGSPNTASTDDPTPSLINDLDVKVTDSNGNEFFPWKLDPAFPNNPATKGVNNVDNVEIVEVNAPAGTYTITVSHKGSLTGNAQDYALIVFGADPGTLSNTEVVLEDFVLYPNPAQSSVKIGFNNQLTGDKIFVDIYDVLGKQVMSQSYENSGRFEKSIDITSLQSGMYIVKVGNGLTATTKKLVVK
ncbi:S8 family serine peptidase [Nonlabens xiamenensis]|uniref:S8 family serine peptidase n=1 Tax=Nonlabens xiamenensis TaxID=2341043 RepID=UPI000F60F788|nr:S8 family serine peptidase [Nonlabens xiamenensis]